MTENHRNCDIPLPSPAIIACHDNLVASMRERLGDYGVAWDAHTRRTIAITAAVLMAHAQESQRAGDPPIFALAIVLDVAHLFVHLADNDPKEADRAPQDTYPDVRLEPSPERDQDA